MSGEREVLEARARALAAPLATEAPAGRPVDAVVFQLAGERFAVDATQVLEALALIAPTPLPGERAWLVGIIAHRGRVLPVFDLRTLLAPAGADGATLTQVVAVAAAGGPFGIAVEGVEETLRIDEDELAAAPPGPFRGVTGDRLMVLDLEALARDPRLRIDEAELT